MLATCLAIVFGYLVGSFPSSLVIGRALKGVDVREHGSGNSGTTNTIRVLGFGWGLIVFVLDALKGALPVVAAYLLWGWVGDGLHWFFGGAAAGTGAMLGHIFPLYAGFKGGKGVATGAGILAALLPLTLLPALGIFGIVLVISGYVSLSSMVAAATLVPWYLLFSRFAEPAADISAAVLCGVLTLVVILLHRKNIARLAAGTESRFDRVRIFAKKGKTSPD